MWHDQKGFNGVAILARDSDPIERVRGGYYPTIRTTRTAAILTAEVQSLVFVVIYGGGYSGPGTCPPGCTTGSAFVGAGGDLRW